LAKRTEPTPEAEVPATLKHDASLNIHQRLLLVASEASYVQKKGRATAGGTYNYAKHDDVMAAVRPALIRYGVGWSINVDPELSRSEPAGKTKSGAEQTLWTLWATLTFFNVDKPDERITSRFVGEGIDTGDKATGKALSYLTKNALLKTFFIESGDEADNEHSGAERGARSAPRNAPASPPAPASNGDPAAAFLRQFWAVARSNKLDEGTIHRWFKRNLGLDSTKAATVDQLKTATDWARNVGDAQRKLGGEVQASGIVPTDVMAHAGEAFGVQHLDELTLEEYADLIGWVGGLADENVPFGNDDDAPFITGEPDDQGKTT
jgi:hypothetical protein